MGYNPVGAEDLVVPTPGINHGARHVWLLSGRLRDLHDHPGEDTGGTNSCTNTLTHPVGLQCILFYCYFYFTMIVFSAVGHFEDAQKHRGPCPQSFTI